MQTKDAILTRRSIRKYKPEPLKKEQLEEMLKSAMQAPSANNFQPWHFIVLQDKNKLQQIPSFHPHAAMAQDAAAAVLVCANSATKEPEGYWVQDCSASTQNLLLSAHDQGIGAVWVGVYPRKERIEAFQKLFDIPPEFIPFSLAVLGYPAENKEKEERFNRQRVHYDKW